MVRRAFGPLLGLEAAEHDLAYERAEKLLCDSLHADDYECYQRRGYVEVPSRIHQGRVYRVDGWRPVAVFEDGEFAGAICIRPRDHLPGPDVVLARKLLIEGAEEEFLASGNWLSPAWRPASAMPALILALVVLMPWLLRAPQFGDWGIALVASIPVVVAVVWWRGRRTRPRRRDAV